MRVYRNVELQRLEWLRCDRIFGPDRTHGAAKPSTKDLRDRRDKVVRMFSTLDRLTVRTDLDPVAFVCRRSGRRRSRQTLYINKFAVSETWSGVDTKEKTLTSCEFFVYLIQKAAEKFLRILLSPLLYDDLEDKYCRHPNSGLRHHQNRK